jgi:hypothetical protein
LDCSRCYLKQPDGRADCVRCGFVFVGADSYADVESLPSDSEYPYTSINKIDRESWISIAIGGSIAITVLSMPWLSFLFTPLVVLVHELGHSITGWLFGYPSIPAFDFVYGGGVTINTGRQTALLALSYVIFLGLIYYCRKNRLTLSVLSGGLLIYSICALTRLHEALILFMGHGLELVIAGIFIYRGLSGSSIIRAVERPLYAFVGIFIVLHDLQFSYRLMTSANYRIEYGEAKGGGDWMDFSRIANEFMGGRLVLVSFLFFICCFLPLLLSFFAFRYQKSLGCLAARLLTKHETDR